ncbi:MAG: hypothetical protein JXA06_03285 [Bacteroidetes bacterium]|nr:hypothetical protein [Bacteroidota bacterium]
MSWMFGIIRSESGINISDSYDKLHSCSLLTISTPKFYLALGGINETCFYEVQDEYKDTGWAIVGLGVKVFDSSARLMTKEDWKRVFANNTLPINSLDGHFVALRWEKDTFELYTDQLGIRTAYYGKCDEGICFSTRLDWMAKKTGFSEINQTALGGRWLLFNQLSYDSCVKGIERLGPASFVSIRNGTVTQHESRKWLPEFKNENNSKIKILLVSLIQAAINSDYTVSLGLSGGMDSRMLLAILLANAPDKFQVHTFGEEADPDVLISNRIARDFNLRCKYFNEPFPDTDEIISQAKSIIAQNLLAEPASSSIKLRYYSRDFLKNGFIIDGGFGEIARRQYLNRIVRLGSSALLRKDIKKLFTLMYVPRADIFADEYADQLKKAVLLDLESVLNDMPPVKEIGVENFVDLLAVRTRFPNWGGLEQARTDASVVSYMPMVQPSFLRAVFRTDIKERANGKTYKEIIRSKERRLKKYPLVKSGTTYPFGLPTLAAYGLVTIKNKISKTFIDTTIDRFLLQIKDYVIDLINTTEVINWKGYDKKKIKAIVDNYYNGDKRFKQSLDWWLTFELWRQSLSNRK